MYSQYKVILPEIPPDWQTVLGPPVWLIEWIDHDGNWQKIEAQQNRTFHLTMCNTMMNPVIAYPYWPEKNIHQRSFYPAGGLFPLDINKDTINLDWQGGIDAQLYIYLSGFQKGGDRPPEQFDWQRFRSLLRTETENEEIKSDPWKVDWKATAEKISRSGFRRSYISARKYTDISITIPESGLWVSPSPFYEGRYWNTGDAVTLKAAESPSRYVSEKGTIVFTGKAWAYFPLY